MTKDVKRCRLYELENRIKEGDLEAWEEYKNRNYSDWRFFVINSGSDEIANDAWELYKKEGHPFLTGIINYGKNEKIKNEAWDLYAKQKNSSAWRFFSLEGTTVKIAEEALSRYIKEFEGNMEYLSANGKTELIKNTAKKVLERIKK